jgi:CelD/BcsL family acetyltransferase involved in cellulose biosynthesis
MNSPEPRAACALHHQIEVSVISDFDELHPRRAEWNELVARAGTSTIFQTYECHASWWKVFGNTGRLLVLIAEADGELVGIAPLMLVEHGRPWGTRKVVQFIGARSFDYADFIVHCDWPAVSALLAARLGEIAPDVDTLYCRDVPQDSATIPALVDVFSAHGWRLDVRRLYSAPTRLFNDPAADRQLANKKSLKRHYNYFMRTGLLEFRDCRSAEEVMPYLDAFFEQHIGRRSSTDTPSVFLDDRARVFFRELVRSLTPHGWLLFSVVLFDQKPIAMHFGFEYGDRLTWYKPAFAIEFAKHSPGEVLIKHLLEYALERKVGELDFTIGDEAFKYRFANHTRANYAVRAFRRARVYHLHRVILASRALVERFPAATAIGRRMLGRWRGRPLF